MKNTNADRLSEPNLKLARTLNIVAWILTVVILGLVAGMRQIHLNTTTDFGALPGVNAMLNTVVAVFLLLALYYIKKGDVRLHRRCMYTALAISTLFLALYVVYHITTADTLFCRQGSMIRTIYFFFLITHVVLAAVSFPFILFTFIRGFTGQYARHRKMARWVYPIWLYVAISGPIVYFLLRPCYA